MFKIRWSNYKSEKRVIDYIPKEKVLPKNLAFPSIQLKRKTTPAQTEFVGKGGTQQISSWSPHATGTKV